MKNLLIKLWHFPQVHLRESELQSRCSSDGHDLYSKYVNDWLSVVASLNKIDELNGFTVFVSKKLKIHVWFSTNLGNMAFVHSCNTMFCPHLPDDNATSLRAIKRLSPSTKANDRFTHPGYEWSGSPFLTTWVNPAAMPFTSLLDSSVTLLWSYCKNNTLNDWGSTLQGRHFCNDKGILQMKEIYWFWTNITSLPPVLPKPLHKLLPVQLLTRAVQYHCACP